ncbi:MAG: glutathione S-transferase family protein [Burkholderiales bacterium]
MLKLYGFSVSNYYNKVKFALLEKNIPFREELVYPNSDEAFLGRTPMGKVPFIETGEGPICESQVIIEYLEDIQPTPPLYPANLHQAAKCRELIQFIELHLELVARRLYGEVFFSRKVSDEVKAEVQQRLQKGVTALAELVKFAPYIAGDMFTYADCAAFAHLPMVAHSSKVIYGKNVLEPINGVAPYLKQIGVRPHAQKVIVDREAALPVFMALIKKRAQITPV